MTAPTPRWWQEGLAYQVWPASFKDSNGDGIGDIPGLISKLDYLKDLGVDILWLSPHYKSPQKDYGYDISDYEDVDPPFGTLQDAEKLIEECHARGMRLIFDLVINHSSDQHAWFLESRSSRTNPKADWFIWKEPKIDSAGNKKPPNNWQAIFGGSAWEYVPEREQYYLHLFLPEQPDLNWEIDTVRKAIYESAIEFWLKKGLDGFRVDTANLYSKITTYPDAPVTRPEEEFQPAFQYYVNGPRIHDWFKELRRDAVDKYGDIVLVGECAGADAETTLKFVSAEAKEINCLFDFDVVSLGGRHSSTRQIHQTYKHTLPEFKTAWKKVQDLVKGTDAWVTVFLENHDQGRSLSRFATDDPQYREKAAKTLAILLSSLTGTLFLYQGQEIGMVNVPSDWGIEELKDCHAMNYYRSMDKKYAGDEVWMERALAGLRRVGRDNARTPVQWSAEPHGGFTSGPKPWMRVNDNYPEINVGKQLDDPKSVFNFWKRLIQVRKANADIMVHGDFYIHDHYDPDVFTFVKENDKRKLVVVLNFSSQVQPWEVPPQVKGKELKLLVATVEETEMGKYLEPWEGRAYLVE